MNPYIKEYLLINNFYNYRIETYNLESSIIRLNKIIEQIKNNIQGLEFNKNNLSIENFRNRISYLKSKLIEGISNKHKGSLSARIKNHQLDIQRLYYQNINL